MESLQTDKFENSNFPMWKKSYLLLVRKKANPKPEWNFALLHVLALITQFLCRCLSCLLLMSAGKSCSSHSWGEPIHAHVWTCLSSARPATGLASSTCVKSCWSFIFGTNTGPLGFWACANLLLECLAKCVFELWPLKEHICIMQYPYLWKEGT